MIDRTGKRPKPQGHGEGTSQEKATPGGERAFVAQMILDSVHLQGRVRWYTSLLGLKASIRPLQASLRQAQVAGQRVFTLTQVS